MADAPPPAAFAPYRDSVDESAPLIPGDAEVGLAGAPAESGTQNGRTSRGFDIRSVTIASQVLLLTSVVVLLLEVAVIILYLVGDNEYKSHWLVEILSGILGTVSARLPHTLRSITADASLQIPLRATQRLSLGGSVMSSVLTHRRPSSLSSYLRRTSPSSPEPARATRRAHRLSQSSSTS